jgi:hypothetical protein
MTDLKKEKCKHEWRLLKNIDGNDERADLEWHYSLFYCIYCLEINEVNRND